MKKFYEETEITQSSQFAQSLPEVAEAKMAAEEAAAGNHMETDMEESQQPGMNTRPIILPGTDRNSTPAPEMTPWPGMSGQPGMGMPQPGMGMPGMGMPQPGMGMPGMGVPQQPGMGMPGMGVPQRPGMGVPGQPGMGMQGIPIPGQPGSRPPMVTGTVITTYPRPNEPCRFCDPNNRQYATVRFLNASAGYSPFTVYVDENVMIRNLQHGEVSAYEKVNSGSHTITLVGPENYVYFQKSIEMPEGDMITVAIINAQTGLDLLPITDEMCQGTFQAGCIRAVNLSPISGPLNVMIGNQDISFINLQYQAVADYRNIRPGRYQYYVTRNMFRNQPGAGSGMVLATAALDVRAGSAITIYIFNWNQYQPDAIRTLVVEERRQEMMR